MRASSNQVDTTSRLTSTVVWEEISLAERFTKPEGPAIGVNDFDVVSKQMSRFGSDPKTILRQTHASWSAILSFGAFVLNIGPAGSMPTIV